MRPVKLPGKKKAAPGLENHWSGKHIITPSGGSNVSAHTLPELNRAHKSYAAYAEHLLAGRCDPAVAAQVVSVVASLEEALRRQAQGEVDIELRLTALEEDVLHQLEIIAATLRRRPD